MLKVEIYIDKDDFKGKIPLHEFLMHLLIENGIAGATTFVGHTGYGVHHRLKQPNALFSLDETPMLLVFIDKKEKVKQAITEIRKQYRGGLIITQTVEQW